ncbi:MAG TPA: hypothetical protein VH763_08310 [Gemmatimonadales bacterium]|jgi:hypothetical protein
MDDEPTCGKGLAANAVLPARLADLIAALAQVLEVHMKALDPADGNARAEHEAYQKLARQGRTAATQLQALSTDMLGYRALPMGRHDPGAMASREPFEAFDRFVRVEEELLQVLQDRLKQDRGMLLQMERAHRGGGAS